jgi:hypothetical protein
MIPVLKKKRTARWQAIMATGLLLAASTPRAELVGRFFFTPQERAALDGQRNNNNINPGTSENSITVNGLVTSSRGHNTVWINGAPQHESELIAATKKKGTPGEIAVKLPDSTRLRPLKVGQTLTPGSGEIREGYQSAAAPDTPSSTAHGGPNSPKK